MKIVLPLLMAGCLVAASSCTTYQLMTVSSPEAQQTKTSEFVIETDSLEVTYNFNGENGPVKMLIRNKLDKPVYVDWNRSALVVNDRAMSYASKTVEINGSARGSSFNWTDDFATTRSTIRAKAEIPSDMDFLPPHAYVMKELIGITSQTLENLPDSIFSKRSLQSIEGYSQVKAASFTAENSPLVFKSYLTLMVGDSLARPMACQHRFYVSELVKTDLSPQAFLGDNRADRFYVIKGQQVSTRPAVMGSVVKGATLTPAVYK